MYSQTGHKFQKWSIFVQSKWRKLKPKLVSKRANVEILIITLWFSNKLGEMRAKFVNILLPQINNDALIIPNHSHAWKKPGRGCQSGSPFSEQRPLSAILSGIHKIKS